MLIPDFKHISGRLQLTIPYGLACELSQCDGVGKFEGSHFIEKRMAIFLFHNYKNIFIFTFIAINQTDQPNELFYFYISALPVTFVYKPTFSICPFMNLASKFLSTHIIKDKILVTYPSSKTRCSRFLLQNNSRLSPSR